MAKWCNHFDCWCNDVCEIIPEEGIDCDGDCRHCEEMEDVT